MIILCKSKRKRGGPRGLPAWRASSATLFAAVVITLTAQCMDMVEGSLWPLKRYTTCEYHTILGGEAQWLEPDVAFDEDSGFYWLTVGPQLLRLRYPDNMLLGGLTAGSDQNSKMSMAVTRISSRRAAIIDRALPQITIIDIAGEDMVKGKVIPLSFVPHSISYDGAYEVFVATSIDDKRTVMEINEDGEVTETLFTLDDDELPGVEISNMHYASNTGTIFFLCTPCREVFEVLYFTGRLKSHASRMNVDSRMGTTTGLSIARTGTPLFLLDDSLQMLEMCQKILPPPPSLPPESATRAADQSWFSINSYTPCGVTQMEKVNGKGFRAMTVAPNTRTLWAWVGGRLREYMLDGGLLRSLESKALLDLGIYGVSSIAWVRPNKLVLGMRVGNRIAYIDTAPNPTSGMGGTEFDEPPGPERELELIRERNLVDLVSLRRVPDSILPKDSLGSISYNRARKTVVFTSSREPSAGVMEMSLDKEDEIAEVLLDGARLSNIPAVDANLYSQGSEKFLMWCSCAQLFEVSKRLKTAVDDRIFDEFLGASGTSAVESFAMSPEGALMLIGTPQGQVNFYCSSGTKTESGMVEVVRSAAISEVDHVYYWRTVEMQLAQVAEKGGLGQRTVDGDLYVQLFGTDCLDFPELQIKQVGSQPDCEDLCSQNAQCEVYSFNLDSGSCKLLEGCEVQALSFTTSSARKSELFPRPGNTPVMDGPGYEYLLRRRCSGPSIQVAAAEQVEACEALCSAEETCRAFTFDFKNGVCIINRWCDFVSNHNWSISARKLVKGSPPLEEHYRYIPMVMCQAETLKVLWGVSADDCEAACTTQPSCRGFSSSVGRRCSLHRMCDQQQPDAGGLSGIKA